MISNNNGSLLSGCSIQARFLLGVPSAVLPQKAVMSLSGSSPSSSEALKASIEQVLQAGSSSVALLGSEQRHFSN